MPIFLPWVRFYSLALLLLCASIAVAEPTAGGPEDFVSNPENCPANSPYLVNGNCSECNSAGRTKMSGSSELDGCCLNGSVVSGGSCVYKCEFYSAHVNQTSIHPYNQDSVTETNSNIANWKAQGGPSCFQTEIDLTIKAGVAMVTALNACYRTNKYPISLKDNYAIIMLLGNLNDIARYTLVSQNMLSTRNCSYGKYAYNPDFAKKYTCLAKGVVDGLSFCKESISYFDSYCRAVDRSDVDAICGNSYLPSQISIIGSGASPISFIWDEQDSRILESATIVDFPLDLSRVGKRWLWLASEKAPLLVYDPEHKANITSATQLFGNWTFGGQKIAAMLGTDAAKKANPWKNGFDALKTLDINNDDVLSGQELEPLALWFDKNSDSISAAGEVVKVDSVGIKKIYFNPDKVDPATGNITATLGYEREKDSKLIRGSSVDWFVQGADSQLELLLKQTYSSQKNPASDNVNLESNASMSDYATDLAEMKFGPLTGVWKWKIDEQHLKNTASSDGFFLIKEDLTSSISGFSVVETPFRGGQKVASASIRYAIKGKKIVNAKGQEINFSSELSNGTIVSSVARIEDNNQTLIGQTKSQIAGPSGGKTISYSWTAYRYNGSK